MSILESLKKRRSYYEIGNDIDVKDEEIKKVISEALIHTPSFYNAQSARAILLLNENHDRLWDIVLDELLTHVSEEERAATEDKVASFKAGYGTILFYEDMGTVEHLQTEMPKYADSFADWSEQSNGMVQIVIWTALRELGLGASLQHYNPIIDEDVAKAFDIPKTLKLRAQMPFGNILSEPDPKEKLPIEKRFKIFK